MVRAQFVDGDEEVYELRENTVWKEPWHYLTDEQAYLIQSIEGDVVIPAGFIKCLRHIEVEND